ncbi:MAG TPA: hypothetical protein VLI92_04545 [Candidatus Saccharimonadales bacterium]|nr:hypothetical protein [Candidatus Saccharimonadales bacterium]
MLNTQLLLQIFLILLIIATTGAMVYTVIILITIHKAIKMFVVAIERMSNPMSYITTVIAAVLTAMKTFKRVKNSGNEGE